jgi:hypothetical protein
MRKKLGALLAWVVTLAILAYLFHTIPLNRVIEAIHSAKVWTVPALVILIVCIYLADSLAIRETFRWFVAPLTYGEVLVVRGTTYLLALVNYTVGQGAIVYFVNRTRGIPVMRGTAAVLLVMGTNLLVLLLLASLGMAISSDIPPQLRYIVFAGYLGLSLYIALIVWKPHWLRNRPLFDVLLSAGLKGHLLAMLVRLPHILALMVFTFTSLSAFGIVIPVHKAIFYLPIVYFVAVLPISFQGLGTSQALMIHFFASYSTAPTIDGRKAAVLAASLVSQALATGIQVMIGFICMRTNLARCLKRSAPTKTIEAHEIPQA